MKIEERKNLKVEKFYCDCCGRQIKTYRADFNRTTKFYSGMIIEGGNYHDNTTYNTISLDLCRRCQNAMIKDFNKFIETYIIMMRDDHKDFELGNKTNEIGYSGLDAIEYIRNKKDLFWKKTKKWWEK